MRNSIFYQPLAVFMAVLMLPPFAWVTGAGQVSSVSVKAQINETGCAPDASRIIQDLGGFCDANWASTADVQAFESNTVSAWLRAHQLPQSDSPVIYQYGRTDLRSELRGYMLGQLLKIIGKPYDQQTDPEKALYKGLQKKVQQHEIELYTAAINEYYRFASDPCHWTPDPDLARQYHLSYDGTPFCVTGQAPQNWAPSYDYFVAYGMLKSSYGKAISDQVNGPLIQTYTGIGLELAVGAIALPTGLAAGLTTGVLVFEYIEAIFPFAARAGASLVTQLGEAGVAAVVVILAVVALITAVFEIFTGQTNDNNLAKLTNQLASAQANLPDLTSFPTNPTGLYKLTATFTALTLPDFPSAQALPAHQDTDLDFVVTSGGQPVSSEGMSYLDWVGTRWTANTYGGWLVQSGVNKTGQAVDRITPTIYYTDWNGNPYSASRTGNNFLITKGQPASTDTTCKADEITGVTTAILTTCSSYVASSFQLMDHQVTGNATDGFVIENGPQFTISLGKKPKFTSAASANFVVGAANTFQITASGNPSPSITKTGALPSGISFTAGNPATLSGTAAAGTEGVYPLTLTATSTAGTITQNFTLNVGTTVAFTSSSNAVFTAGQSGSFTITTTGKPTPTLTDTIPMPAGLSFRDNGDGTGTISGTPAAPFRSTIFPCAIDCGIVATNALGSVLQALKITVNPAPLTIASSPSGLQLTVSAPDGYTCPSSGTHTTPMILNLYLEDKCVLAFASPLSGGTGTQYVFQNWGFETSNPRTVTAPPSATTYTALFQTQY